MTIPRFVLPSLITSASGIEITGTVLDHLRACRVKKGDRIIVTDGRGGQQFARVSSATRRAALLQPIDGELRDRESELEITLFQALLKGDTMTYVIEKATELGVRRIVPIETQRTIAGASEARLERWRRVAVRATEQSQRRFVPEVTPPSSIQQIPNRTTAKTPAGNPGPAIALWELADAPYPASISQPVSSVALLSGPEGGMTKEEIELLANRGWTVASLGPRILRATTAAVVAITLAQSTYGDVRLTGQLTLPHDALP